MSALLIQGRQECLPSCCYFPHMLSFPFETRIMRTHASLRLDLSSIPPREPGSMRFCANNLRFFTDGGGHKLAQIRVLRLYLAELGLSQANNA